jgi:hypothetical protein
MSFDTLAWPVLELVQLSPGNLLQSVIVIGGMDAHNS